MSRDTLHLILFALVACAIVTGVVTFAVSVAEVGSCGLGPAAPRVCPSDTFGSRAG